MYFMFDVALAGFFDGQSGQRFGIGAACGGHTFDDRVDLLLAVGAVLLPGGVGLFDFSTDLLYGNEGFVFEHQPSDFLTGPAPGNTFSVSSCGRGITCTATSSPPQRAAAAPASVSALIAP